jgi:hypothetical protein
MQRETYTTRKGETQFRPVISESEFRAESENYTGFCLACGNTQGCCEPDARRYSCEDCRQMKVYGLEELLMMGLVIITGDSE